MLTTQHFNSFDYLLAFIAQILEDNAHIIVDKLNYASTKTMTVFDLTHLCVLHITESSPTILNCFPRNYPHPSQQVSIVQLYLDTRYTLSLSSIRSSKLTKSRFTSAFFHTTASFFVQSIFQTHLLVLSFESTLINDVTFFTNTINVIFDICSHRETLSVSNDPVSSRLPMSLRRPKEQFYKYRDKSRKKYISILHF